MKTILFAVIITLCAVMASAIMNPIQVTALNASTYTAINVPSDYRNNGGCVPVLAYLEGGASFLLATDSAGTDEATWPANTGLSNDCIKARGSAGTVFYAKSASATPNLILVIGTDK